MSEQLPSGIERVPVLFVNAYLVDIDPNDPAAGWFLVDTGIRGAGDRQITRAAAYRYGSDVAPHAIVLTHGHFDHAGSAKSLAERWHVPIFAHTLELPYLTNRSKYPPPDPTVGGALALMSRAFPSGATDLTGHVHPLDSERLPFATGWRAMHSPGHTGGHVSLFRESDRLLLAGDAFATMNQDAWATTVTTPRELRWPPAPLTTDWDAAEASIRHLAELRPQAVAAGHGLPIGGAHVPELLESFARAFKRPAHGRYISQPARTDERGVVQVPPPVPDPVGARLQMVAGYTAVAALMLTLGRTRRGA